MINDSLFSYTQQTGLEGEIRQQRNILEELLKKSECAYIPKKLLEYKRLTKKLTINDCIALTVIYQWGDNKPLAYLDALEKWLFIDKKNIKQLLNKLTKLGFLSQENLSSQEIFVIIASKKPQFQYEADLSCEWCKCTTFILHEHHYPIPRSKGGQDIVKICANCHYEFHFLQTVKTYKLTDQALAFFEDAENGDALTIDGDDHHE